MNTRYQIRHVPTGDVLNSTFGFMVQAEIFLAAQGANLSRSQYVIEPFILMDELGLTGAERGQ